MSSFEVTIKEVLRAAIKDLLDPTNKSLNDGAFLDAQILLAHVLQVDRSYLFTWPDLPVSLENLQKFTALLQLRLTGVPIAYCIKQREFWGLKLMVSPATLIPRHDTELLIEIILALQLPIKITIADLGTGSGAIAFALASERIDWNIVGIDASQDALAVANFNLAKLGFTNVKFILGDWCQPLADNSCHIIVANPPYIAAADPHLLQGDLRFEPHSALVSGVDGLDDIRKIVAQAADKLVQGGYLLIEHGYNQGVRVREIFAAHGYVDIKTHLDLSGHERVTMGLFLG